MTDTLAQHKKLAKRMDTGLSRSINDNPLLRWQVINSQELNDFIDLRSAILSCFRIFDPSKLSIKVTTFLFQRNIDLLRLEASLDDFLAWYGGMDEHVDAISMQEIWGGCSSCDAKDQKPLFKAEQEAEKALGYLEGLSLTQLAAALLSSGHFLSFHSLTLHIIAMTSFYFMITCDIKLKSYQSMTTADDYDEYLEFQADLERLETQVTFQRLYYPEY